ncbi:hypothetical protein ACA910_014496 [Epithemia clementina (nom. ined.)]
MSDSGLKLLRDDRSAGDSHSIASSSDDVLIDDKYHKQKRRGSGLGGIANYFKANIIRGGRNHKGGVPNHVNPEGLTEDSSRSSDKEQKSSSTPSERSPQEFLDVMWRTRGYSRDLYFTLETAYFNNPSPLQVTSYHTRVIEMARENKIADIRNLMAAGISNNPCNEKGESLMHELCRLGLHDLLAVLINEFGADVQISNSSGKTPLHDACVGGSDGPLFAVVDLLATKDRRMFSLKDADGKTPLDYIPMEQWGAWIDYLYVRRDAYWPRRLVRADGEEPPPPLTVEKPNSRTVADPYGALTIDLAGVLVSGDMTPEQVSACQKKGTGGIACSDEGTAETVADDGSSN